MTVQRQSSELDHAHLGQEFVRHVNELIPQLSKAALELEDYGGLLGYAPPSNVREARELLTRVREAAVALNLRLQQDDFAECQCGSEGDSDVCPGHVMLVALDEGISQ